MSKRNIMIAIPVVILLLIVLTGAILANHSHQHEVWEKGLRTNSFELKERAKGRGSSDGISMIFGIIPACASYISENLADGISEGIYGTSGRKGRTIDINFALRMNELEKFEGKRIEMEKEYKENISYIDYKLKRLNKGEDKERVALENEKQELTENFERFTKAGNELHLVELATRLGDYEKADKAYLNYTTMMRMNELLDGKSDR